MTAPTDPTRPPLGLSDIVPFVDFCREAEKLKLATRSGLQWMLRYRHENGLIASGAVVEKRLNPTAKRPALFIVKPRFIAWLANDSQKAA